MGPRRIAANDCALTECAYTVFQWHASFSSHPRSRVNPVEAVQVERVASWPSFHCRQASREGAFPHDSCAARDVQPFQREYDSRKSLASADTSILISSPLRVRTARGSLWHRSQVRRLSALRHTSQRMGIVYTCRPNEGVRSVRTALANDRVVGLLLPTSPQVEHLLPAKVTRAGL